MKWMKWIKGITIAVIWVMIGAYWGERIHAQTVPTTLQLTGSAPHTTCAVVAATTNFCFANDGLWQSINGGAYVQLTPASAAPVLSVNGKTGVVVISATTTSTTTLQ